MNNNKKEKSSYPLIGTMINVQAYKYNGMLYRQWNGAKVIRNTKDHYVLLMYKTKVGEISKKDWVYRDPVIWFMPKNALHNALVLLKQSGNYIYVNISSKPIYEDNTIKFVDYDIDIKKYPGKKLAIVDQDEFKEHIKEYKYPLKLIKQVEKSLEEVIYQSIKNEYFFNKTILNYYVKLAQKDHFIKSDLNLDTKINSSKMETKNNFKKAKKPTK
ncbi:hypothetical protein MM26B8_03750 [Mycoplasmopsis meleagridis]|uniref:RNAse G and E associated domain containing protein n=1 Tax=Mycoplasmopsis meleagridis ATCC 25294 TaxID=1264554 RepID=A0A0F5H0M3_9BACT|nr:DUF402 domain-containing protein [Mycoplasmopsis meleagridis]KKB26871.1 RNAse G and E associated domain containing protein [Mycoplasmopsis meleagridis ATCC 25294]OAD18300.1 hypothetical protein MM26B8_03750 [Mycoplasmopsis meleagridis]VEU77527.1 Protein of uncharacterised function (DUF402) [Mycoplasmopsis meleagridis]